MNKAPTSTKLQQRLTRYSLAAGAAGLVAGAHQADAAIKLYDNGGAGWTINDNQSLWFTYNGNTFGANPGSVFRLSNTPGYSSGGSWIGAYRLVDGQGGSDSVIPRPLASGASIPGTESRVGLPVNFTLGGVAKNSWPVPGSGYLGLAFQVGADKYYGWMDITLDAYVAGGGDTIVVNRFAVEDTPNTPILAGDTGGAGGGGGSAVPEPGTLGLLVLGATGLAALRRREG